MLCPELAEGLAGVTGFEPAVFAVTGRYPKPLDDTPVLAIVAWLLVARLLSNI